LTDFIPKDEWPPSSPDLNPLDFSIWRYMLGILRNFKYATLLEFKKVIQRIWANIPEHVVRAACDAFDNRLRLVKPKDHLLNKMIFFESQICILNKKLKLSLFGFLEKKV
jgi:hypothetical protein